VSGFTEHVEPKQRIDVVAHNIRHSLTSLINYGDDDSIYCFVRDLRILLASGKQSPALESYRPRDQPLNPKFLVILSGRKLFGGLKGVSAYVFKGLNGGT
jgi:hypothetical protein